MKSHPAVIAPLIAALALVVYAEPQVDESVIARIKTEAFQHSQVMDTLSELTDLYGGRLRGSPGYVAAAEWVKQKLTGWGFERVSFEPGGFPGPGWQITRFSVEMTEPQYLHAIAQPLAWSPSTNSRVSGTPVLVEVASPADFEKYRGKLKGVIVLNGRPGNRPATNFSPTATRYTDDQLTRGSSAIDPTETVLVNYAGPDYAGAERARREGLERRAAIAKFFRDEGVAALLVASPLSSGVIAATDAGGFDLSGPNWKIPNPDLAPPSFVLAREHYGRIARLIERKRPVKLELQLDAEIIRQVKSVNIIAEMAGRDPRLAEEVVMLGAHFDSWHTGSGATDNAAGSVVMMEALRILKAIGAMPRRTIRLALWDAEEGGHLGSSTYVLNHFGDPRTMTLKPEHAKLAGYFNLDNGTGKIRGVFLQGNESVRPIFENWLKPFAALGATALAVQRVGGTDHLDFDHVGLPAFQFIQDPIDYETRTHHTNMDVLESIQEADLQEAAAIVAAFVYHTAMRDEKLPRVALPKAPQF
jgi:carboxypeptidase Q